MKVKIDENRSELANWICTIFPQGNARLTACVFGEQAKFIRAWLGVFHSSAIFSKHCIFGLLFLLQNFLHEKYKLYKNLQKAAGIVDFWRNKNPREWITKLPKWQQNILEENGILFNEINVENKNFCFLFLLNKPNEMFIYPIYHFWQKFYYISFFCCCYFMHVHFIVTPSSFELKTQNHWCH